MKKILCFVLCITMLLSMAITVGAANEFVGAKKFDLGSSVSKPLSDSDDNQVYKFKLANPAKVDATFVGDMERVYLRLYDEEGNQLWGETPRWNDTTEQITYQSTFYLNKGTYYYQVANYYEHFGNFTLRIENTDTYESFAEETKGSNNTVKTSNNINLGTKYTGFIASNDEVDVYAFDLFQTGKLDFVFNANVERVEIKLYDELGNQIWSERPRWNDTTEYTSYQMSEYLCRGKYYISFSRYSGYGEYTFNLALTGSFESFSENQGGNNNKVNAASLININQKYVGAITLNDDVDIYRINITDPWIQLHVDGNVERLELKLYDEMGNQIWNERPRWNDTTQAISFTTEPKLDAGLYYFSVSRYSGHGNYSFYFTNGGAVSEQQLSNSVITVRVNGSPIGFDQPPIAENGRTLVPLRAIFEALGASVEWDGTTQTVTSRKDSTIITLQLGSSEMYVNGKIVRLDVPAKAINGRTLVPVRAISEAFGCTVTWDGNTQTVYITQ